MKKIILLISALVLSTGCVNICTTKRTYEYVDTFGEHGTSNNCYQLYEAGGLYCEIGEDTVIQVSQYQLINSEKICS